MSLPFASPKALTLLLLDDHPLYQLGFAHGMQALRPEVEVLCASTLADALALTGTRAVDAVLIDMHLHEPHTDGLCALAVFSRLHPQVPRLIITGDTRSQLPHTCRSQGADGFVMKSDDLSSMWLSIRRALERRPWYLPDAPGQASDQHLTMRQLQVLQLLSEGMSNRDIAAALQLTERSIKMHVSNLLQIGAVSNRVGLLRVARERGWLQK